MRPLPSTGASEDDPPDSLVPVAEYLRMSTDHQRYSTENQAAAIRDYAKQHGMNVVQTYADEGKSGLGAIGRDAFRKLLSDVLAGSVPFRAILVYDVSRWGRFQNTDQSAHYEYLCTEAGIPVIYCAEPFENDGTPVTAIIKNIKRTMDGEYSRVLSTKVFAGQCRLVKLGFHQGGAAGYGLRRELIDEQRNSKGLLQFRQHKSIQTDRVILAPGPPQEVDVVCKIYQRFVESGMSEKAIAQALNEEDTTTDLGRPWTRGTVHQVLTNEKYIGNNVYNRQSFKLKQRHVRNAPDQWIRCDGAFQGIVSTALFEAARAIILRRSHRLDDEQMLGMLSALLKRAGSLSGLIIDEQEGMPSSSVYGTRFGGLLRAYELIGYRPERDYSFLEINRALRRWRPNVVAGVVEQMQAVGATVNHNTQTDLLTVNDEWTASVIIARCQSTQAGSLRWQFGFDFTLAPDVTIAIRMDPANRQARDYYLVPRIDMGAWPQRVGEDNNSLIDSYRFDTLEILENLAARSPLKEAA